MALSYKLSQKQQWRSYKNYLSRYTAKKEIMEKHGTSMYDTRPMTFDDYLAARDALVESGRKININQTLVSRQQYEFTQEQGRALRNVGQELGLEFGREDMVNLRGGGDIRMEDLTLINNRLKELYPNMSGIERGQYITHYVFGDSE